MQKRIISEKIITDSKMFIAHHIVKQLGNMDMVKTLISGVKMGLLKHHAEYINDIIILLSSCISITK